MAGGQKEKGGHATSLGRNNGTAQLFQRGALTRGASEVAKVVEGYGEDLAWAARPALQVLPPLERGINDDGNGLGVAERRYAAGLQGATGSRLTRGENHREGGGPADGRRDGMSTRGTTRMSGRDVIKGTMRAKGNGEGRMGSGSWITLNPDRTSASESETSEQPRRAIPRCFARAAGSSRCLQVLPRSARAVTGMRRAKQPWDESERKQI